MSYSDTKTLLSNVRAHGLTVNTIGDQLAVKPKEKLTPELRAEIQANKDALIFELRWRENLDAIRARLSDLFKNNQGEWIELERRIERRIGLMVKSGLPLEEAQTQGEAITLLEWITERPTLCP